MSPRGVALFPGAGSSSDHPALIAIERALHPLPTGRFDFPYRKAGKKFPDKTEVLVSCVVEEVSSLARAIGCATSDIVIGGRSMGGRMCSIAIAEGLQVAGLVCIGYPLHPPKKPEQLRTAHLPQVGVPSFVRERNQGRVRHARRTAPRVARDAHCSADRVHRRWPTRTEGQGR
ncbi:MAG: alpha/beta family hydrolase [Ilumatobacteraceae bacterium]